MTDYIKEPHTAIFTGQTGSGKTHLVLELIEKECNNHFDYIIIICLTLRWNMTYHPRAWIKNDNNIWFIEPPKNIIHRTLRDNKIILEKVNELYYWIEKLSQLLACSEVLLMIDDIIADKGLDKRRQPLLNLSISIRHRGHYCWLLTPSYKRIPKKLREQTETIFVWYPKARIDLKMIHEENDVLTNDELVVARGTLKKSKHACLYIRNEYPHGFCVE